MSNIRNYNFHHRAEHHSYHNDFKFHGKKHHGNVEDMPRIQPFPRCGNLERMPEISNPENRCIPNPGNAENTPNDQADIIAKITEQFTSLLQNVFSVLGEALQGLLNAVGNQQQPGDTTTEPVPADPAPTPPTTPAPQDPAPVEQPPAADTPAVEAPADEDPKPGKPDIIANAKKLDPKGEFLWKSRSEKDGNLVILLPSELTGNVKNVRIVDENGEKIEKGDFSGVANGDREHFRFNKPGKKYPDGCYVIITTKNGDTYKVKIGDTSENKVR